MTTPKKPQRFNPKLYDWDDLDNKTVDPILGQLPKVRKPDRTRSRTVEFTPQRSDLHSTNEDSTHSAPPDLATEEYENDMQSHNTLERYTASRVRRNGSLSGPGDSTPTQRIERYRKKINELQEQLENQAREMEGQTRELELTNEDIQKLLLENRELKEDKQTIIEKWTNAADEIQRMRDEKNYNQDDPFFEGKWRNLKYQIKRCADDHFSQDPKRGVFTRAPKDEFRRLSFDYKGYLKSGAHRSLIMQSMIWHFLTEKIFGSRQSGSINGWDKEKGESFQTLFKLFRPGAQPIDPKVFHSWRACTAGLLHEDARASAKKAQEGKKLADHMVVIMKPWLSGNVEAFNQNLNQIVALAFDMDAEIQKQRAHYFVQGWRLSAFSEVSNLLSPKTVFFDPTIMESFDGQVASVNGKPLSLVVSPALAKTGNSEGESYDVMRVVVKASVIPQGPLNMARMASRSSMDTPRTPGGFDPNMPSASTLKRSPSSDYAQNTAMTITGTRFPKPQPNGLMESKSTSKKPKWYQGY